MPHNSALAPVTRPHCPQCGSTAVWSCRQGTTPTACTVCGWEHPDWDGLVGEVDNNDPHAQVTPRCSECGGGCPDECEG